MSNTNDNDRVSVSKNNNECKTEEAAFKNWIQTERKKGFKEPQSIFQQAKTLLDQTVKAIQSCDG
ncbi:MAG: hypothetical protein EP298_06040 [Gammaproteobacteria bacterium]|nr:MAG: hypothetical protein EP298_06040 [Gammaproteobacteria bacterium]UTW41481.1 hypothetical protein KFE69_08135 [bacterium SCSIO 12844]